VKGSILVRLSQDFGNVDPHIWAIEGRIPILGGAGDQLLFSGVGPGCVGKDFSGSLRHNQILAILRGMSTFGRVYWICPIFGGGMGPMSNLQNPKEQNFICGS
jgi:hypothetical protein